MAADVICLSVLLCQPFSLACCPESLLHHSPRHFPRPYPLQSPLQSPSPFSLQSALQIPLRPTPLHLIEVDAVAVSPAVCASDPTHPMGDHHQFQIPWETTTPQISLSAPLHSTPSHWSRCPGGLPCSPRFRSRSAPLHSISFESMSLQSPLRVCTSGLHSAPLHSISLESVPLQSPLHSALEIPLRFI